MAIAATKHTGVNFAAIFKPFIAFGALLIKLGESNARVRAVRELDNMSDDRLAELGLKREDIVHHVFRDTYYM